MSNIKTLYNKFISIGVRDDQFFTRQNRVRYTNIIALTNIFIIAIPFIVFSAIFFPTLTYLPVIFFVSCLFSILLLHFNFTSLGRFIISTSPVIIGTIYHALIISVKEQPLTSINLFLMACSLIPFIVFELKERNILLFATSICFILLISINKINFLFEADIDSGIFYKTATQFISLAVSIMVAFIYTFILASTTRSCEMNSYELSASLNSKKNRIDELNSQLNKTVEEMEAFKLEQEKLKELEKQREWINSGITKFVDILRLNNDKISELTYNVISNLVKYLGANQGGIFMLVEEDNDIEDPYFELTASYAYDKRKYLKKKILFGEGLVGNCALEKKHIHLKKIPRDYIKITSGLGDAPPQSLILIPIINEEKVYGVIEIASFREFQEFEIEFVSKVAENIASAVLNTMMHNKTNALIEEMKKQAELSQAQEEELRQNIEEMQATQEEMAKKETLLKELAKEVGIEEEIINKRLRQNKKGA